MWLLKLAYLSDNVFHMNLLIKPLQGQFTRVIDFVDNGQAFIMKLELVGWQNQRRNFQHV